MSTLCHVAQGGVNSEVASSNADGTVGLQTSGNKKAGSGTICAAGGNTSKLRRDCCRRRNRL
jgi:hypothetical protein